MKIHEQNEELKSGIDTYSQLHTSHVQLQNSSKCSEDKLGAFHLENLKLKSIVDSHETAIRLKNAFIQELNVNVYAKRRIILLN